MARIPKVLRIDDSECKTLQLMVTPVVSQIFMMNLAAPFICEFFTKPLTESLP